MVSAILLLVTSCFADHMAAKSLSEQGPRTEAHQNPSADSGVPIAADAGPATPGREPEPVLRCELARAEFTCLESFAAPAGVPFLLPYSFSNCGCCAQSECLAEVDEEAGTIRLTTTQCPDYCDCDGCNEIGGACEVPALASGSYDVIVNDAPAFTLPVVEDIGSRPPAAGCVSYAEADMCEGSLPLDAPQFEPSVACVEHTSLWNRYQLALSAHCVRCGQLNGPCAVMVEERLTDDFPSGGEIRISPTQYETGCDVDCNDRCSSGERRCEIPPLERGGFYRVWYGDELLLTFVAAHEGESHCNADDD